MENEWPKIVVNLTLGYLLLLIHKWRFYQFLFISFLYFLGLLDLLLLFDIIKFLLDLALYLLKLLIFLEVVLLYLGVSKINYFGLIYFFNFATGLHDNLSSFLII